MTSGSRFECKKYGGILGRTVVFCFFSAALKEGGGGGGFTVLGYQSQL